MPDFNSTFGGNSGSFSIASSFDALLNKYVDPNDKMQSSIGPELLKDYIIPPVNKETQAKIDKFTAISVKMEQNVVRSISDKINPNETRFTLNYRKDLNTMQYAAVVLNNCPLLVLAGAGSGKTRVLTYKVAYLIESGFRPSEILALTFTNKAAKEMVSRISSTLPSRGVKSMMCGTFHSFANSVLKKYSALAGLDNGFVIIQPDDCVGIINMFRSEMDILKGKKGFPKNDMIYGIFSKAKNLSLSLKDTIEKHYPYYEEFFPFLEILEKKFTQYKASRNQFDFDDLIDKLLTLLEKNTAFREAILSQYKYVMVDEFQDTNVPQRHIVDLLVKEHKRIMVVGDDIQSIYGFRGANFENILLFPETYPDCKVIKLEDNYRSSQSILDFTNAIIQTTLFGYKKVMQSPTGVGEKPVVIKFQTRELQAEGIVNEIVKLYRLGKRYRDIAVLYRSSAHGNHIQTALTQKRIPFIVVGGMQFSARRHVKDLMAYLKILVNPKDAVSWHRILHIIPGIGDATAIAISDHVSEINTIDFTPFGGRKFSDPLQFLGRILKECQSPVMPIKEKISEIRNYYAPLLSGICTDYHERLDDFDALMDISAKYGCDLDKFLSDFALKDDDEEEDRNEDYITLTTVHSSKGLEWDVVFVIDVLDGLFPSDRSMSTIEQIEEEKRLFYVAASRPREKLFLTLPISVTNYDVTYDKVSRFLAELPQRVYSVKHA